MYDLSLLKGQNGSDGRPGSDGTDGVDGLPGKDGDTPFIGENGTWWIGTTDTGVKAAASDGEPGDKGDPEEKGDPGNDGICTGWFYATGGSPPYFSSERKGAPVFSGKTELRRSGILQSEYDHTQKRPYLQRVHQRVDCRKHQLRRAVLRCDDRRL